MTEEPKILTETGGAQILPNGGLGCLDCGERYGGPYFPDLVIDNDAFAKIAPNPPDGGLLCPNCINARLESVGLTNVKARFRSGPMAEVSDNNAGSNKKQQKTVGPKRMWLYQADKIDADPTLVLVHISPAQPPFDDEQTEYIRADLAAQIRREALEEAAQEAERWLRLWQNWSEPRCAPDQDNRGGGITYGRIQAAETIIGDIRALAEQENTE